jgi:thiamine pyrophosphate-dependent acetolactate synthase large subunit-like protein
MFCFKSVGAKGLYVDKAENLRHVIEEFLKADGPVVLNGMCCCVFVLLESNY